MKFRRFLSSLLFGLGCALSFVGILTLVLPAIPNPQIKLVLASFAMTSDNAAVSLINRFMTFALEANWRLLGIGMLIAAAGAWLLIHFTPKRATAQPVSQPHTAVPFPKAVEAPLESAPNPFAVGTYNDHLPEKLQSSRTSPLLSPEPILERNPIESSEGASDRETTDEKPFYSARLETESRAIETELGSPSQSGSRILIRSVFEPPAPAATPLTKPDDEPPASAPEPAAPPAASVNSSSLPPFSPRIRSTMGRHSTNISKFPSSHP